MLQMFIFNQKIAIRQLLVCRWDLKFRLYRNILTLIDSRFYNCRHLELVGCSIIKQISEMSACGDDELSRGQLFK